MKKSSSSSNMQKNSPLYNFVFILVLLFTALPFILFALLQFAPPSFGSSKKTIAAVDSSSKRMTAEERRAAREEARKASEAAALAQRNNTTAPIMTTTTITGPGMGKYILPSLSRDDK